MHPAAGLTNEAPIGGEGVMEDFGSFGTFDRVFDSERGVGKNEK
jgi:hypothetical protein